MSVFGVLPNQENSFYIDATIRWEHRSGIFLATVRLEVVLSPWPQIRIMQWLTRRGMVTPRDQSARMGHSLLCWGVDKSHPFRNVQCRYTGEYRFSSLRCLPGRFEPSSPEYPGASQSCNL